MKNIINILKSAKFEIALKWYRGENPRIQITLFELFDAFDDRSFEIFCICIFKLYFSISIEYEVEG